MSDENDDEKFTNIYESLKYQFDFVDNLPNNIKDSINNYTLNAYTAVNTKLRNNEKLLKIEQDILDDIDYAFKNVPPTSSQITLYRAVNSSHPVYQHDKLEGFNPKKMTSVISATYDIESTGEFYNDKTKCCILVITVPAGSRILPIENISEFKEEREILLNRNGAYYITGRGERIHEFHWEKDTVYTYYITYIPKDSVIV
jgi:hypothetical protein